MSGFQLTPMPSKEHIQDQLPISRRFFSDVATLDKGNRVSLPKSFLSSNGWLDRPDVLSLVAELGEPGVVSLYRLESVEKALVQRHDELLAEADDREEGVLALKAFEDRYRQAQFYRSHEYRVRLPEGVFLHLGVPLKGADRRVFIRVSDVSIEIMSLEHRTKILSDDSDGWMPR